MIPADDIDIHPQGREFMKLLRIPVAIILILLIWSISALALDDYSNYRQESSSSKIEKAYEAGQITRADRDFYNIQAIFDPESLPLSLSAETETIIKSGTHYIIDALENWESFSPDQQSLLAQYLARPDYDTTYISPESNFAIHYDTLLTNAVPSEDLNDNDIPDYVERVGIYADSAFRAYTNMGYLPAPSDGDQYYDIYLLQIGAYGATVPENPADSAWDDYTSFIKFHCSFAGFNGNDDPEGDVIGDQKVTAAHEFFHAVQLAYSAFLDRWWMESTSTYFEDYLFPEVNDNYQYLPYFYNFPEIGLLDQGWHMYASFIWPAFLKENYGVEIIRTIYEYGIDFGAIVSTDSALAPYGKKVEDIFPVFSMWNYFTGDRAIPGEFFPDAASYPMVAETQVTGLPYSGYSPAILPEGLSANYMMFYPDPADDGYVRFKFSNNLTARWGLACVNYSGDDPELFYPTMGYQHAHTSWGYYDVMLLDSVLIIPTVVTQYLSGYDYDLTTDLVTWGDLDTSDAVNILDIIFLIDYKFKNGPEPPYDLKIADFDCDGFVNVLDIIYIIDYKFHDGPIIAPCREE